LEPYSSESDQSPGVYLRNLPVNHPSAGTPSTADYLANQSELRASTADKAAFYLDAALASRSADTRGRESHLLFTLHVYQYSVQGGGTSGVTGGRSRLHLLDFGGCERTKTPGGGITLSGLGNVILGIFNGQKHLPHRESKVTQLLRECLGSLTCQATMLAHVSPEPSHYSETLHTVQLASRLHRMRRKRLKNSSSRLRGASGSSRSGSGSSSGLTTSTAASSSEFSCDTVVYRGQSDGSGTDSEHPPGAMLLRTSRNGSLDEIPRPASGNGRRKKILTNGAISPRLCMSPLRSPASGIRSNSSLSGGMNAFAGLAAIPEVVNSGKMPLTGLVPVQSSHRLRLQQQQQQQQKQEQCSIDSPKRSGSRQEVWIDEQPPPQTQQPKKMSYGYMDEQKASMINSWVENQTGKGDSVFLTQFKQVESDDSNEHKVIVHQEVLQPPLDVVKKSKPPPPPRRTPPRDLGGSSLVSGIPETVPMIDDAEIFQVEESTEQVPTTEMSCQVDELELRENSALPEPGPHPLRVLSEENLTIVSSFAGSLQELPNDEDLDDLRNDEIDASKLTFFNVPDFSQINDQQDMIKQTFRDFEEMQHQQKPSRSSSDSSSRVSPNDTDFSDPRFKNQEHGDNRNSDVLRTFSSCNPGPQDPLFNVNKALNIQPLRPKAEIITPQKQFLLLSQSLRHPDGSSNPELHNATDAVVPQRSPGNGRSSSDMEEDNKINDISMDSNNGNTVDDTSPASVCNNNCPVVAESETKVTKTKEGFGFRFLRLFTSTRHKKNNSQNDKRSKSCERKLDNPRLQTLTENQVRSASSSPMIKKLDQPQQTTFEDPAMLSISTEWEFEPQEEDSQNGNMPSCFDHILIQNSSSSSSNINKGIIKNKVVKDRKSSGYDSVGGDESSSLDSNESKNNQQSIRLSKEMNNSLAKAFFSNKPKRPSMIHPEIQPQYSMPNDYYGQVANLHSGLHNGLSIMQYDELDIIRMDQRHKPFTSN
jgi:hypothetical protein